MSVGVEKSYRIQYIVYQKDQAETKRWKPGLFWQEVDRLVSAKIRESVHIEEGINYDKSSKKYQCVIEKYESNERSSVKILCHYLKIHPKTSIIKNYNVRGKRCSGYRRKARKNDEINHGIGLKSVQNIAEKYGGILKTNVADNWFETSVIMYEK